MANKFSEVWGNEKKEKEIVELLKKGKTYAYIQHHYKTSSKVVFRIKEKYGVPIKRNSKVSKRSRVISMYKNGYKVSTISSIVELSKSRCWAILKESGSIKKNIKVSEYEERDVECICPGCGKGYFRKAFYTGVIPWRKYGDDCCSSKALSKTSYSGTQPVQRCQARGI